MLWRNTDGLCDLFVARRLDFEADGGVEVILEEMQQIACSTSGIGSR